MATTVTWVGMRELQAKLLAAGAAGPVVMGRALYEVAQEILNRSQELVPVELGTLRSSGFVSEPKIDAKGATVEIGYGGAASEYAVIQHEDTTLNHPRGGQAKFLEEPALEAAELIGSKATLRASLIFKGGA